MYVVGGDCILDFAYYTIISDSVLVKIYIFLKQSIHS